MFANCKDELPNPHRTCLHDTLNAIICHDNDLRRVNVEIRDLQNEFDAEMEKLEIKNRDLRKPICDGYNDLNAFTKHIDNIDKMQECFKNRISTLKKNRDEILDMARKCLTQLNSEKCKFKKFHENTIEYLKRYAVDSDDINVIKNCEKDICELHQMFVKEVTYIKKCENELTSFLQQVKGPDYEEFCKCCCFVDYEWIPKERTLDAVEKLGIDLKEIMGNTLIKAFAQMQISQPKDTKSFLASYLMNLHYNEEMLKEKLKLLTNLK